MNSRRRALLLWTRGKAIQPLVTTGCGGRLLESARAAGWAIYHGEFAETRAQAAVDRGSRAMINLPSPADGSLISAPALAKLASGGSTARRPVALPPSPPRPCPAANFTPPCPPF